MINLFPQKSEIAIRQDAAPNAIQTQGKTVAADGMAMNSDIYCHQQSLNF